MAKSSYTTRIKARISELMKIISEANRELEELRVAERVLDRLATEGGDNATEGSDLERAKEPTIGEVIQEVLRYLGPLDVPSIVDSVNAMRQVPASQATIQSTLSRAKSAGLVENAGGKWRLVAERGESMSNEKKEAPYGASDGWE